MDLHLTDKIALVTGSSRGLGLASARALLDERCRVAICARCAERLETALGDLLLAVAREARREGLDPESALRNAVRRLGG